MPSQGVLNLSVISPDVHSFFHAFHLSNAALTTQKVLGMTTGSRFDEPAAGIESGLVLP